MTEAIKAYVEEKVARACHHFGQVTAVTIEQHRTAMNHCSNAQVIREVDVTLSARGGDTGTQGKKEQKVEVRTAPLTQVPECALNAL